MKYVKLFLKKLLRYVLKPLSFLPALIMMYVIFSFSAQDGDVSGAVSSSVSLRFVQACEQVLDKDWNDALLNKKSAELIAKGEPDTFDYAEFIAAGKAEKQREKEEKNTYHRSV